MKTQKELRELIFIARDDKSSVDKATRTLKNVVVLRPKSANGYTYTAAAMTQFAEKAGNPKSYFDHSMFSNTNRSVRELAGYLDNIRLEGDAIRGDAHIGPVEYGDMVLWLAEEQPNVVGFSSVSEAMMNDEGTEVLEILQVISVDIVTNPATVKGLFESAQNKEPQMDEKEKLRLDGEIKTLEEKVKNLTSQVSTLTTERDAVLEANRKFARESFVNKALSEAKLPEKSVTPLFRSQLLEADDEASVKALIEDRKAVLGDAVSAQSSSIMTNTPAPSKGENPISEGDVANMASAFPK